MKTLRVFPRKTNATPDDKLVTFKGPGLFLPFIDEVHVSVTFIEDKDRSEVIANEWSKYYPTKIDGPAYDNWGYNFEPGMYLKKGYVITSRGCPNKCWFCLVPKREGDIRELQIRDGFNVLDNNLLACSEKHIKSVFLMLKRQKEKAQFTGGLEAARLKDWHIDLLVDLKPTQMFFAYDTPDDYEPLVVASKKLREAGFNRNILRCYVLIGYPKDTMENAESRLISVKNLGFCPMAMLYNNNNYDWKRFQREWARPAIIYKKN